MLDKITVKLKGREYDILVGHDWIASFGTEIRERGLDGDIILFTSPRIGGLYFDAVEKSLLDSGFARVVRYDIPDGEENKNFDEYRKALQALTDNFPDPGNVPLVVNLGGGVVTDLSAFAASTFRRGISYVQMPTTLLGCVDCGIGGKTGVNFGGIKNLLGTIYQPKLVLADLSVLSTLDPREVRSGMAEVIKGAATNDAKLFEFLEENMDAALKLEQEPLVRIVADSYRMKAGVVVEDEFDKLGKRIVLNFGHTAGHAIEMVANYKLTHGEAVSLGMLIATRIAVQLDICDESVYERLNALIEKAGLPVSAKELQMDVDQVMETMKRDKKFVSGKNRFVLPTKIGGWKVAEDINLDLIRSNVELALA